uniref:Glycosyl transferase group 1 n=1 Tax=Cyanothece sp. (strain PCC 7425 / ATCC 29141) TaxID=395961 RepID=B8HLI7_CYAP4
MKVLHLVAGNLFGGVETFLCTLAEQRHACPSMQPHFGICFEGLLSERLRAAGVPVYNLGAVRLSRPWQVISARGQLSQLMAQDNFDAVISHSCWPHVLFAPVIRRAGRPLVFYCHDLHTGEHWLERWAKLTPPDFSLVNSYCTLAALPRLFPQGDRAVIYCPVYLPDLSEPTLLRSQIRSQLQVSPETTVIIQVSRLERWKGHSLLLAALSQLRDCPNWVCWLVGGDQRPQETRYLQELKQQALSSGIADRVQFLGQRSDVPDLLTAADIHCQPNTDPEPFGITFIEALAAGLPVVTTAIGGGKEIVNASCGLLVPPADAIELAAALKFLILDPQARTNLGANGRLRARTLCDPQQQLQKLYDVLREQQERACAKFAPGPG